MNSNSVILVFGATGQQGGSVVTALLKSGWSVRAMVRDTSSQNSALLRDAGVDVVEGTFDDPDKMRAAMKGAYGVFSVQPSSPGGAVTDEEEVRYGKTIADLAVDGDIKHLIYSSGSAAGEKPTGVAHYDTKADIESYIRKLPIVSTIVRPATFMELLTMPGFGLDEKRFTFFMQPEQAMQVLAVQDIGKIIAAIYSDPLRFGGKTFEIASDAVTGLELEAFFSEAAGHPIPYSRFTDDTLTANPFLQKLTSLVDDGRLAGNADLHFLRQINPELLSFKSWLKGPGHAAFKKALGTSGEWKFNEQSPG